MNHLLVLHLAKDNMGAPVRRIRSSGWSSPCVTALVVPHGETSWCLIADHPKNAGVSVTNGFVELAQEICLELRRPAQSLSWFELDSCGAFNQVQLAGGSATFSSLRVSDLPGRSAEAFKARVLPWSGEVGAAVEQELLSLTGRFR